MRPNKKRAAAFLLVWSAYVLNGTFFALLLPLWGGFDEWLHYGYIGYVQQEGKLPVLGRPSIGSDVAESLLWMPADGYRSGQKTLPEFWALETGARDRILSNLASVRNRGASEFVLASWQGQHPPLYYVLMSPFYALLQGRSILHSAQTLRVVSILISSLALLPLYSLFRRFLSARESLLGLLLFACYPATFIRFGHIANDALALVFASWALSLIFKQWQEGVRPAQSALLGLAFGLGLISKLYCLSLLPAILALYAWAAVAGAGRKQAAAGLACFCLPAVLMSLPWILHNLHVYGTWNSSVHNVMTAGWSAADKLRGAAQVDWKAFAFSNLIGMLWQGNWSFAAFPAPVYRAFACALIGVAAGFALAVWDSRRDRKKMSGLFLLAAVQAAFLLGMIQHQVHIRLAGNPDPMMGAYWAVLLPSQILIAFLAMKRLFAAAAPRALDAALALSYFLTAFGASAVLLPYYSGLVARPDLGRRLFSMREALARLSALNDLPFPTWPTLAGGSILAFVLAFRCSKRIGDEPD